MDAGTDWVSPYERPPVEPDQSAGDYLGSRSVPDPSAGPLLRPVYVYLLMGSLSFAMGVAASIAGQNLGLWS